jgi:hypothetical protein
MFIPAFVVTGFLVTWWCSATLHELPLRCHRRRIGRQQVGGGRTGRSRLGLWGHRIAD